MPKHSIAEYALLAFFKFFSACIRALPVGLRLWCGRRIGDLLFFFDVRHKARVFAQINRACGDGRSPRQIDGLTRRFYRHFGQSIVEMLFLPAITTAYIRRYISFEGMEHVQEAFRRGKGVILLGVHAGSWEISNVICANLGFPFYLFVRGQRSSLLNELLNRYRSQKGCRLIERESQLRTLVSALRRNEAIGMTLDQGGKNGVLVDFLGRTASFATGAVKLALRYGATILPAYYTRESGPRIKTIIAPAFVVSRSGEEEADIRANVQALARIYEGFIRRYPAEYYWPYKIWKYSSQRTVLVLSDSKAGHQRQAEAVAAEVGRLYAQRKIRCALVTVPVRFRSRWRERLFSLGCLGAGRYRCQGCQRCVSWALDAQTQRAVSGVCPDVVVSCGQSVAAVNVQISRFHDACSIVVMRPSLLGLSRFDLAVVPQHDRAPQRANVVKTFGALSTFDPEVARAQARQLCASTAGVLQESGAYVGVLLGGDARGFCLDEILARRVLCQAFAAAERLQAKVLVSTSRRSSASVEKAVKEECRAHERCALSVIANEQNWPFAAGGIMGLCRVAVVSPESISMISEAASAGCRVVSFEGGPGGKHRRFLEEFVQRGYVRIAPVERLQEALEAAWGAPVPQLLEENRLRLEKALGRVLP